MPRGRTKKTVKEPNIDWTKHTRNTRHRKKEMENLEKDIKNLMGEFDIIKPKRPRSSGTRPEGKRTSGTRPEGKRTSGTRPEGKRTKRVDPRHKRFKPRVAGNHRALTIDIANTDGFKYDNNTTISSLKYGTFGEGNYFELTPEFINDKPLQLSTRQTRIVNRMHHGESAHPKTKRKKRKKKRKKKI
jgi:hypothetical protein